MRLVIVSTKQRFAGYTEFVGALNALGAEAICVHDLKYCYLGETKPLYIIPTPKLLKLVKRFNPDFVMTDSPYYITHMMKLINHRVLFHMRGAEEGSLIDRNWDIALYPSFFARMYTHYLAKMIIPCMKKADLVLPNCKWLQKQVEQYVPAHQTRVLYVGIDPEKWIPNPNTKLDINYPAVVGVFQFTIYAKVSGLLKFIRVAKRMPDVNFYFAGEGPYMNLIKRKCPSNMFLVGGISRSKVKKLLESGELFVHPSGLDALPRSVKEASLMEKPIIASNIGGIPEIVKNDKTGYLCEIDDVDQWVEKLRFLLDNPSIAREFGRNARRFVTATFDWKVIAKGFLSDLRALGESEDK